MAAALTGYEILGHLASGGMGEILLARRLGPAGFAKQVVLKRPLGATTRAHATALIDEARLLARINHPNVCQVHDLEEGEAGYFLVLEYLEGMSCWTLLACAERAAVALPPGALCGLFEQVCDGLEAIHALTARDGRPAGIVHRDISPGNLFLTETGFAKILDLGIAKTDEDEPTAPGVGPRGKLPYLSPEQVAGRAVDRRADLFSLGLVLYDLARGQRPAPDRVGALAAPALALAALPAPLVEVIRIAVEIDPARRFATASAMAAALRRAGNALGGSFGRAELAAWLSAQFAAVLAARRAGLPSGAAQEAPSVTRVELRSLVRDAGGGAGGESTVTVVDGPPSAAHDPAAADRLASDAAGGETGHATAELPPPLPLIRERAHPAIGQVEALVAARIGVPQRRPGRALRIAVAAVATVAVALGVTVWWRSTKEPSRPAPPVAAAFEAPAAPPGAPAATPPANAPGSAPRTPPPDTTETQRPAPPPDPSAPRPTAPSPSAPAPAAPPPTRHAAPAAEAARRPGRLSVDSEPFAVIELDGRSLGATPLYRVPVAAGRHWLRAETGDGRVQRRVIEVASGAVAAVVLHWAAGAADDAR